MLRSPLRGEGGVGLQTYLGLKGLAFVGLASGMGVTTLQGISGFHMTGRSARICGFELNSRKSPKIAKERFGFKG